MMHQNWMVPVAIEMRIFLSSFCKSAEEKTIKRIELRQMNYNELQDEIKSRGLLTKWKSFTKAVKNR